MTSGLEHMPGGFVVVFFHTKTGELRCRVTNVLERKTWLVEGAPTLFRLLAKGGPPVTDEGETCP